MSSICPYHAICSRRSCYGKTKPGCSSAALTWGALHFFFGWRASGQIATGNELISYRGRYNVPV